ncbi:MAG: hypothetical protein AB3X41_05000 [Leptothrix ochracea]|uniref:pilus assembly PilX family protein n=1 Tax=Leptothrix ochracea TaxID=735331 RepID=UPI0034E24C84
MRQRTFLSGIWRHAAPRARQTQQGMTLIFALITMLALSMAAVALIRSVDTGAGILGNLSFKRDTLLAADTAMRSGVAWVAARSGNVELQTDQPGGYYASYFARFDPVGHSKDPQRTAVDWDGDNCAAAKANGVAIAACIVPSDVINLRGGALKARYVIERLCDKPGNMLTTAMICTKPMVTIVNSMVKGEISYQSAPPPGAPALQQFFRVTVRTQGARNSTSFTETIVHF